MITALLKGRTEGLKLRRPPGSPALESVKIKMVQALAAQRISQPKR